MSSVYVNYLTPFRSDKNIGRAYNEACATAPEGSWICLRDPDTMFLQPDSQALIEQIVASDPPFDLIGCRTNRLRGDHQCIRMMFDEKNIGPHIEIARELADKNKTLIISTTEPIAGMFMLFKKSLWDRIKFDETAIRFTDKKFSADVMAAGGKLGVAQGFYLFHLYRWGSNNPYTDIEHLLPLGESF